MAWSCDDASEIAVFATDGSGDDSEHATRVKTAIRLAMITSAGLDFWRVGKKLMGIIVIAGV